MSSSTLARELLDKRRSAVEGGLDRFLPAEEGEFAELAKAMRYSIFAGGKRLRPLLALAAAEAVGTEADKVLDEACSLELIHTYTLIHDDLPAMDDDDLRRGKPTSHKVFGEAVAILAGDALQTLGFSVLARAGDLKRHSPGLALEASGMLARAAGSCGVIGGQVVDIESEGRPVTLDRALPHVRRLYVSDPFGNRIEFIQDGEGFSQIAET